MEIKKVFILKNSFIYNVEDFLNMIFSLIVDEKFDIKEVTFKKENVFKKSIVSLIEDTKIDRANFVPFFIQLEDAIQNNVFKNIKMSNNKFEIVLTEEKIECSELCFNTIMSKYLIAE